MQPALNCNVSQNSTLGTIALILTIAVGICTIHHLYHQSKLTKLQLAAHEAKPHLI